MLNRFLAKTRITLLYQRVLSITLTFLLIEFYDELNFGLEGAALPVIRDDYGLTYAQIGLLLGAPHLFATLIEPFIMLLGDTRLRKTLILSGGLAITLALLMIAWGHTFVVLVIAMLIAYPASGAFVSLSQATLMDLNPGRQAKLMARWTAAGSIGNLLGPLLLAAGLSMGWGWRWAFLLLAGMAMFLVLGMLPQSMPPPAVDHPISSFSGTVKNLGAGLWSAIRNRTLFRWLVLMELADLMMDRFISYVPLYFTDVIGASPSQSSLLLTGIMAANLAADLAVIPLLEKISGLKLVRLSAAFCIGIFVAAMLVPWAWMKIGLFTLVSLTTLGWYPVLQGEAYATIPGRSGTVMAVNSMTGVVSAGIAWFIGWLAEQAGLGNAMWFLVLGPISLVFLARSSQANKPAYNPNEPELDVSQGTSLD